MTPLQTVLLAFSTWLLGLLTPGIVDAIRRPQERRELAAALRVELGELQQRLALNAFYVWNQHGLLTQERLQWLTDALKRGPQPIRLRDESLEGIKKLATLSDAELAPINAHNKRASNDSGISMRHVDAPFLSAHLGRLFLFDANTQRELLHIRAQIQFFNEQVSETAEFFKMTFSKDLGEENWRRVEGNLARGEQRIATRSEVLANVIGKLQIK